ncbi:hypothetical protein Tco_1334813 [Tanacetum coccineum]
MQWRQKLDAVVVRLQQEVLQLPRKAGLDGCVINRDAVAKESSRATLSRLRLDAVEDVNSMDVPFNNISVTNLVLDDVLEGEDVDFINADGFDSDPGKDDEIRRRRRRWVQFLSPLVFQ